MRVRFGDMLFSCSVVRHSADSNLLFCTTPNGVFTVDMPTKVEANEVYADLLIVGFFDFSRYDYTIAE